MNKKLRVIDLFAGCGGLSDGFEQTEFYNTLACVEWEKEPCRTLKKRLETKWGIKSLNDAVLHFDIQRSEELLNGWKNDPIYGSHKGLKEIVGQQNLDIVIGGPPCQAYSVAGRVRDGNGMHDDYRNFLFESYIKVVDAFKPKLFVFENVPGMLSAKPGGISIIERITKAFSEVGYDIIKDLKNNALLDCTHYGVPQSRKRIVIVGVNRLDLKTNPQELLNDFYKNILPKYKSNKIFNVKDAISDLPALNPLKNSIILSGKKFSHSFHVGYPELSNHIPRMHNIRDIEIFKTLALDIESGENRYLKTETLKKLYYQKTGKHSNIHKYHVLKWERPSNTIPAHLYKDGLRHIHPDPKQSRTITVREAARLQSFDDDFIFLGNLTDQYKMIGNAVPPKFAKAIGYSIHDLIKKYYA